MDINRGAFGCPCALTAPNSHSLPNVLADDWFLVPGETHELGASDVYLEAKMGIRENGQLVEVNFRKGLLLYVTDPVNDSQDVLEFACELAEKHGAHLEILHVIDPEQTSSSPDAQMGIQCSLEALARSLRNLRRDTQARLLFGHPEDVISRRAAETQAALIAISESGSSDEQAQKALVRRLSQTCTCPVLIFSAFSVIGMRNNSGLKLAFR